MIVLIRSNDINPDPRLQKYIDFLDLKKETYLVLGWNRSKMILEKENYKYFHRQAKYGSKMLNIFNKLRWFWFIYTFLIKNVGRYDIVHACDFDTAFPSYVAKLTTKKKMIFDVFDWMSDSRNNSLIYKVIGFFERKSFAASEYAIICEPERRKQIPVEKECVLVMPNIPTIEFVEDLVIKESTNKIRQKYNLILSYVGVFDASRGIEDLLKIVSENENICLNIAGFGRLEEQIKDYSEKYANIIYWGKVDYNTGLNIMKESDLIVALYYNTNPLHEFAAPNKYYEGLFLGVPIITTKKTLVGMKTDVENTGFVIYEGEECLKNLLDDPDLKKILNVKSVNSLSLWKDEYENYIETFMEDEYLPIIRGFEHQNRNVGN